LRFAASAKSGAKQAAMSQRDAILSHQGFKRYPIFSGNSKKTRGAAAGTGRSIRPSSFMMESAFLSGESAQFPFLGDYLLELVQIQSKEKSRPEPDQLRDSRHDHRHGIFLSTAHLKPIFSKPCALNAARAICGNFLARLERLTASYLLTKAIREFISLSPFIDWAMSRINRESVLSLRCFRA
jgi:hypothetical protein